MPSAGSSTMNRPMASPPSSGGSAGCNEQEIGDRRIGDVELAAVELSSRQRHVRRGSRARGCSSRRRASLSAKPAIFFLATAGRKKRSRCCRCRSSRSARCRGGCGAPTSSTQTPAHIAQFLAHDAVADLVETGRRRRFRDSGRPGGQAHPSARTPRAAELISPLPRRQPVADAPTDTGA